MTTTMTAIEARARLKLEPGNRVGIVAGSGALPAEVAASLVKIGHRPFIVLAGGEVDPGTSLTEHEHQTMELENLGALVPVLRRHGVTHLVLAGGIARRPDWRAIRPSLGLAKLLPRIIASLARGDDGLIKAIVHAIESHGIKIVGAHEIVPDLLAAAGALTRLKPTRSDHADLHAAAVAARAIGALDIGQAAIAIGGRAVALEGIEGTDGLLQRARDLRSNGRIAAKTRGVLVKCAKPGQELRADLPTIGPATVEAAHAAGLAGIGVEAGRSIILDQAGVVERADRLGLFVVGLPESAFA